MTTTTITTERSAAGAELRTVLVGRSSSSSKAAVALDDRRSVTRRAQGALERAVALSGGVGATAGHPSTEGSRCARRGAFAHPLGSTPASDHVARPALGIEPR